MGGAWKESKELDVRAQAFQLISIFNWKLDRECIDGVTGSLIKDLKPPQPPGFNNRLSTQHQLRMFAAMHRAEHEISAPAQRRPRLRRVARKDAVHAASPPLP
jgi:hypothetical protein